MRDAAPFSRPLPLGGQLVLNNATTMNGLQRRRQSNTKGELRRRQRGRRRWRYSGCGGGLIVSSLALLLLSTQPHHMCESFTVGRQQHRQQQSYLPQSKQTCPASTASTASASSLVQLNLLKGLVSNVEDEIRTEEELATMNPVDFLKTRQNDESMLDKVKVLMDRMKSSTGDTENKMQLLQDQRTYANAELLDVDHNELAPTLDDLNQKQPSLSKSYWVLPPFRMLVLFGSYFAFPFVAELLKALITISSSEYDIISEQFAPGVGILYGTFVALTLEILYDRQSQVQENSTLEASLLSQVTQNMLSLFRDEIYIAREASQIVADQVRIIVKRTRGAEMLSIMRADPYARILSLVDHYQKDKDEDLTPQKEALIDCLRAEIPQLMEARARRLSDEASALPPTHFLVLSLLTGLSLIGFTTATLTITDEYGRPPQESCLVFAALTAIYVLFYNFCKDLNDPFDGVYQIKRSSAASYLLQIKWIIANQSFGNEVRFDDVGAAQVYDGVEGEEWTAAAVVSGGGVINNNVVGGVEDGYDDEEDDVDYEEAPLLLNGDTSSSKVEERVNGTNESMDSTMAEMTTVSSSTSSSSSEILTSLSSSSPLMEGINTNGLATSVGTTEKTSSTPPPAAAVVKAVTREFGYISAPPREKEQQQQEQQHTMESKTGKGGTKEKEDTSAIVQTNDEAVAMSMTSEQQQQLSVSTHIAGGMNEEGDDAAAVTHSSVTKKEEETLELVAEKTAAAVTDFGKEAAAAAVLSATTAAAAQQSLATEEAQTQTSDPVVVVDTVTETAVVGSGKKEAEETLVSDAAVAAAVAPVHTNSTTVPATKKKEPLQGVPTISPSSTTHTTASKSKDNDYATAAKLYFRSMGGFGGSDSGSGQTKAATNVLAKKEEEKRILFQERVRIRDDKQRRKAEADSAAVRAAAATDAAVEKQQKEGKARVSIVKEEGEKTKVVATGGSGHEAAAVADAHHGTKEEHNVLADHKGTAVKLEDTHNVVEDDERVVKVTGQTSKDEFRLVKEVAAEEERAKAKTGAKEQEEDAKRLVEEEKAKTEAEAKAKAAQEEEEERRLAAEAEAKAKEAEEEEAKRAAAAAAEEEEARRLAAEEEKAKAAAEAEEEEAARAAAAAAKEAEAQKKRQQQQQQEKEDAKLKPMKDRATGIQFEPKIGPDLYLTGVGVRKKAIINIYSVAMYTSRDVKATLATLSRSNQSKKKMALDTLRTETKLYPTSFVLQMAFKVGAEQMASAIAESVAPRHTNKGDNTDVEELKKLIFDGVSSNKKGATKGTTFRFDCYPNEGVDVTVNGIEQGMVPSSNLSDSFCDVYLDDKAVSPALRENCLQNWCEP